MEGRWKDGEREIEGDGGEKKRERETGVGRGGRQGTRGRESSDGTRQGRREGERGRREEEKERKGEGVNVGPCSDCLTPTD